MLVSAVVATVLIGISAMGFASMMSAMTVAQARVQRSSNWNALQNNITNVLKNQNSCSQTVMQLSSVTTTPQPLSILLSGGTAVVTNNANLGYQLTNAKITLAAVGTPVPITVTQTVNQVTQTPCGQTDINAVQVQVQEYIQQAQINVSAYYMPRNQPFSQVYYVNVLLNANNQVLGCN
jgi:hypothetical protein